MNRERPPHSRILALLAGAVGVLGTLALSTSCAPGEVPQETAPPQQETAADPLPAGPAGTVLFVGDLPATATEIDQLATSVELLYPSYTTNHARRIVLAEYTLPRLAVASAFPEERERARTACEETLPELGEDPEEAWLAKRGAVRFDVQGHWKKLGGVDMWTLARSLDEGEWSEPFERTGTFSLVRRGPITSTGDTLHHEMLELTIVTFPYLAVEDALVLAEEALDQARLRIVDPQWEEIVPEEFQYRMGAR